MYMLAQGHACRGHKLVHGVLHKTNKRPERRFLIHVHQQKPSNKRHSLGITNLQTDTLCKAGTACMFVCHYPAPPCPFTMKCLCTTDACLSAAAQPLGISQARLH